MFAAFLGSFCWRGRDDGIRFFGLHAFASVIRVTSGKFRAKFYTFPSLVLSAFKIFRIAIRLKAVS